MTTTILLARNILSATAPSPTSRAESFVVGAAALGALAACSGDDAGAPTTAAAVDDDVAFTYGDIAVTVPRAPRRVRPRCGSTTTDARISTSGGSA